MMQGAAEDIAEGLALLLRAKSLEPYGWSRLASIPRRMGKGMSERQVVLLVAEQRGHGLAKAA
jgi:hypothetical protein